MQSKEQWGNRTIRFCRKENLVESEKGVEMQGISEYLKSFHEEEELDQLI